MNHPVRRRRALGVLLGVLICQMGLGYGYTLSALAGDILTELDWSRVTYSGARAPQIFVIALASPLVGAATVRFGSRRILACAAGLLGVAFVLLSSFDSLWQLYGIVLLMGLAVAGLGDVSKLAGTDLSMIAATGVEITTDSPIVVRSAEIGGTGHFTVTKELAEKIRFSSGSPASLTFRSATELATGDLGFTLPDEGLLSIHADVTAKHAPPASRTELLATFRPKPCRAPSTKLTRPA